jgi:cyclic pyranopterin monophosphate synthase
MTDFPHLSESGEVHMVDVGGKDITERVAVAECLVTMSESTSAALFGGDLPKGDALATIRLAGIMGAKRTPDLIPLCHPVAITGVEVRVESHSGGARIEATVRTRGQTGVEMEAMTAVSVAALTLYDMVKGVEKGVEIGPLRLLTKSGGRSGTWTK